MTKEIPNNVSEAVDTRRKRPKRRSLQSVNEQVEDADNTVAPTQVVIQSCTKRVFLECTPTYSTDMTTGIQRVVRNLVHYACTANSTGQAEIIPVIFQGNKLFAIPGDTFSEKPDSHSQTEIDNKGIISVLLDLNKNTSIIYIKDKLRGRLYPFFAFIKRIYAFFIVRLKSKHTQIIPINPGEQDVIVLVDVFWGRNHWDDLASYRKGGTKIVFILYDLVRISCKDLYGSQMAKEFDDYLEKMLANSDLILCISKSVQNDLQEYINKKSFPSDNKLPIINFFHLGADFINKNGNKNNIRPYLKEIYQNNETPAFLMVSTFEPRKNHNYLLDVFEKLWSFGSSARLLLVGRNGWLSDELIKRLTSHQNLNKKLFVFHDLNDAEVSFCYQHSTALVFPSFAEGFGLPIIEALQNGLPVIASDIPVHREIAQNKIMYIDPHNPATLVQLVQEISIDGVPKEFTPENFKWMNWQQATEQFLKKVLEVKA